MRARPLVPGPAVPSEGGDHILYLYLEYSTMYFESALATAGAALLDPQHWLLVAALVTSQQQREGA